MRSIFLFVVSWFIFVADIFFFYDFIMPFIIPLIPDASWLVLFVIGIAFWPFVSLLIYSSILAFGREKVDWKWAHTFFIITLVYIVALAFLFGKIIPSDYEPFRSIILPFTVYAITVQVISRTRVGQRLKDLSQSKG